MSKNILLVTLLAATGCSGSAPDDETIARVTVVELHPDRPAEVRMVDRVPKSQLQAKQAGAIGVQQSAISVTNPCGYYGFGTSYVAMYVDPNYSTTDGIICFSGSGVAYLRDYCWSGGPGFCYLTWDQVGKQSWASFKNGGSGYYGYFYDGTNQTNFAPDTAQAHSDSPAEYAVSVVISP